MSVRLGVHRCRFVDYTPSPVTAIAFAPLPFPYPNNKSPIPSPQSFGPLIVGHSNGNIDICLWSGSQNSSQSHQAWTIQKTLVGPHSSKVDSLALVIRDSTTLSVEQVPDLPDLRLFSSGNGSTLLEWDLSGTSIRRSINSQGGTIWSLAANPSHSHLALGCEDGIIRIILIQDDQLVHYRSFEHVNARVLSISWAPPVSSNVNRSSDIDDTDKSTEDWHWKDSWLVSGGSDSSLRKWDVSSGKVIERMHVDKFRGERTLVWSLVVLGDGTIVSGDSLGHVRFWDSKTCTQLQSFKGHGADVLCMVASPDGQAIYTSGVDQRVTQFSLVKTSNSAGRYSRWVQSVSRRLHCHEVRSLAIWPPYTCAPLSQRRALNIHASPILASGGLDMSVVLTPAAAATATAVKIRNPLLTSTECTFEESHHRRIAYPCGPSNNPATVIVSPLRLVFSFKENSVSAWHIPRHFPDTEPREEQASPELLLEMELRLETNILSGTVSPDGSWIVLSDAEETKLFSVQKVGENLKPHRYRSFSSTIRSALGEELSPSTSSAQCAFSPDSTKLVLVGSSLPWVLVLDVSGEEPTVLRLFLQHCSEKFELGEGVLRAQSMQKTKHNPILRMTISPDGQWLATSDEVGRTMVFNLDALQHQCSLPKFPKHVQALAFDSVSSNLLILAFPDNSLQIFDVESGHFPSWFTGTNHQLPASLGEASDPIIGIVTPPISTIGEASYILLWGSTWMAKLRFDQSKGSNNADKKRRRQPTGVKGQATLGDDLNDFKILRGYRPILNVNFLDDNEIVIIERPLGDVLATLSRPYFTEKYGKT